MVRSDRVAGLTGVDVVLNDAIRVLVAKTSRPLVAKSAAQFLRIGAFVIGKFRKINISQPASNTKEVSGSDLAPKLMAAAAELDTTGKVDSATSQLFQGDRSMAAFKAPLDGSYATDMCKDKWDGKGVEPILCGGAKTAYWELLHLIAAGAELCIAGKKTLSTVGEKDLCSVLASAAKSKTTGAKKTLLQTGGGILGIGVVDQGSCL